MGRLLWLKNRRIMTTRKKKSTKKNMATMKKKCPTTKKPIIKRLSEWIAKFEALKKGSKASKSL